MRAYVDGHDGPVLEDGVLTYWRTIVNVHGLPPIDVVRFVSLAGRALGYWQHSHEFETRSLAIWTKHGGTAAMHHNVDVDEARRLVATYHEIPVRRNEMSAVKFERRDGAIWVTMPASGAAAPLSDADAETAMRQLLALLPAEHACTCGDASGPCDACQSRAEAMIGRTVRDDLGREWIVKEIGERNHCATVDGGQYWSLLDDVEVIA